MSGRPGEAALPGGPRARRPGAGAISGRVRTRRPGRCRGQRGQATAEAAFVIPVLIALILGAVALGQLVHNQTVVLLAANQAARLGGVLYGDPAVPADLARERLRLAALDMLRHAMRATDHRVLVDTTPEDVSVTVTTTYRPLVPWLGGNGVELSRRVTYRIEWL